MKAPATAIAAALCVACLAAMPDKPSARSDTDTDAVAADRIERSDAEWRRLLDENAYRVLRQQGTEPPFRNAYWNSKEPGRYLCAGCGAALFSSERKYDSGTGWPSFYQALDPDRIEEVADRSHGMVRTEARCRRCGGHLGHVFPDGPEPTGLRYCINSAALDFVPADDADKTGAATP